MCRIETRNTPDGWIARNDRRKPEEREHEQARDRIDVSQARIRCAQQPDSGERRDAAAERAKHQQSRDVAHDERDQRSWSRAERGTHRELTCALQNVLRDHAIESEYREKESNQPERSEPTADPALSSELTAHLDDERLRDAWICGRLDVA